MKRRITAWAQNKWKDPVWSKVIANAIWYGPMVFVGGLLLKVWKSIDINSFVIVKDFIVRYLLYELSIPVWYIIVGIPLISCAVWLYWRIRKAIGKQVLEKQNEIWSEQLGDYTFGQLYRILEETRLLTKTPKMRNSQIGPPNASLLELFGYYREKFNDGLKNSVETIIGYQIPEEDGGYLIDIVAPELLKYKLLDKIEEEGFVINHRVLYITYETSSIGYKFFDCWDRLSDRQRVS